ncbi:sensor histidine kinase [Intestinimonas butyriciproducens]|uniref:sensor histidine kinase n=1 Tax=Intestinimonas butyriciproducens TaxID=1297617 RepID=UPI00195808B0|nr:HAMP domain-containing sensor histidine kinase [Intestinimonas butyriciproducens]MBM6917241.1 HAMP domain-containing histidine kinase [Intestinimonas butyriciproducens]
MRKISVKLKITLWITLLMTILFLFLVAFTLFISRTVVLSSARQQLVSTTRNSVGNISFSQGKLGTTEGFSFYQNGVSILVYSQSESLLAGQLPVSFTASEPFQNGQVRTVEGAGISYLVLDFWLPSSWEEGVWVRGLMEVPNDEQTSENLMKIAAIALPVFILLTAVGGYLLVHRAFRPLERISATAQAMGEAKDLSRRIGLPPGRDEFSRLAQTFDQLFARLERSFEAEKQFTADASHELRTPVSIIKGACEYGLKYDETPEERQETLEMIARQAEKMAQLIAQLLSMTRLDQGTEGARLEPVDLGALVEGLIRERGYEEDKLILSVAPGVKVQGDGALLSRLTENLVENALKYGKTGGHVWVTVKSQGNEGILEVRDDGIGIPKDQQEKIWQRFYQVDPSRSDESSGVGLGLSMVRQIAQLHGGTVTLDSVEGIGSVFALHLPLQNEKM